MQSPPCETPPACEKSHRISFRTEIGLNSSATALKPKHEMFLQSWASQVVLDTSPHTHFDFFSSSEFHGLVPCPWMMPVVRGLGSAAGFTLPAAGVGAHARPAQGLLQGNVPGSAFLRGHSAPVSTGNPWGGCSGCEQGAKHQ